MKTVRAAVLRNVIFLKAGRHADEDIDAILERKRKEPIVFWGHSGNVRSALLRKKIGVLHHQDCVDGEGASCEVWVLIHCNPDYKDPSMGREGEAFWYVDADGMCQLIPNGVHVTGSSKAILIDDLQEVLIPDFRYSDYDFLKGDGTERERADKSIAKSSISLGVLTRTAQPGETCKPGKPGRFLLGRAVAPYQLDVFEWPRCYLANKQQSDGRRGRPQCCNHSSIKMKRNHDIYEKKEEGIMMDRRSKIWHRNRWMSVSDLISS